MLVVRNNSSVNFQSSCSDSAAVLSQLHADLELTGPYIGPHRQLGCPAVQLLLMPTKRSYYAE